jgi:hypothetical protein
MIDNRIYTIVNQLVNGAAGKKKRKIVNEIYNDILTKPPIKILREEGITCLALNQSRPGIDGN